MATIGADTQIDAKAAAHRSEGECGAFTAQLLGDTYTIASVASPDAQRHRVTIVCIG